jgi:hypothetical protein
MVRSNSFPQRGQVLGERRYVKTLVSPSFDLT